MRAKHLAAREESEQRAFREFVDTARDRSNPVYLPKGGINLPQHAENIAGLMPDAVVAYGCSLIKDTLINAFPRRFLNVHLGLSPYYRGSGTNYWPLVEGKPEYVGATFMYIDIGVDTGEIIHQMRARVFAGDAPADIGNRLIADMVPVCARIIRNLEELPVMPQPPVPQHVHFCRKKDYSEDSVRRVYEQFDAGLV